MNQLILVSTLKEIQPFLDITGTLAKAEAHELITVNDKSSIFVSGVGAPSTIFYLTRLLAKNSFERVIQVGVAGSYKKELSLGSLFEVGEDCFADLGIDDKGNFRSLFKIGLVEKDEAPFTQGQLINPVQNITGLPTVKSITVNTVSGSAKLIEQRKSGFNPDLESMEGAAAFYVCLQMNIPVLQVRAVSNIVEPRNRASWEMDLAINNLNKWLVSFVKAGK